MISSRSVRSIGMIVFAALLFCFFFNGYSNEGPARRKFRKLPGGVEDLTTPTAEPARPMKDYLKDLKGNRRLLAWTKWWQQCLPGFSLDALDDMGDSELEGIDVATAEVEEAMKGPGKMFFATAPGGQRILDPWWGRLAFKKEGDAWQPYIEIPCGALLYEPKKSRARMVMTCAYTEGLDDAIWLSKDVVAVMGYESVTRQMSVECESTESCTAPAIWIFDFSAGWQREWRGPLTSRKQCSLGGYLKVRLPDFFGKETATPAKTPAKGP
jgi:hypothetical protein